MINLGKVCMERFMDTLENIQFHEFICEKAGKKLNNPREQQGG